MVWLAYTTDVDVGEVVGEKGFGKTLVSSGCWVEESSIPRREQHFKKRAAFQESRVIGVLTTGGPYNKCMQIIRRFLVKLKYRVFFLTGTPLKSTKKLIEAGLGVSGPIYVAVDSPNQGFPYFNFLWGVPVKTRTSKM